MAADKLDGGGLGLSDLSELADSFKTISEIFAKLAREQKKAPADPVGAQGKRK